MKNAKLKPKKPSKHYPLFPHANGQWAKKINGKLHYFGPWAAPHAALAEYKKVHAYLFAGQQPPVEGVSLTIHEHCASSSTYCGAGNTL